MFERFYVMLLAVCIFAYRTLTAASKGSSRQTNKTNKQTEHENKLSSPMLSLSRT